MYMYMYIHSVLYATFWLVVINGLCVYVHVHVQKMYTHTHTHTHMHTHTHTHTYTHKHVHVKDRMPALFITTCMYMYLLVAPLCSWNKTR